MEVSFLTLVYSIRRMAFVVASYGRTNNCVFSVDPVVKSALGRCKKLIVLASTLLYIN